MKGTPPPLLHYLLTCSSLMKKKLLAKNYDNVPSVLLIPFNIDNGKVLIIRVL